jgi:propionyl-CoA carboxylase alpha chain
MISKILVANRGEIARRIYRTCREMGIATVAVHSVVDQDEPHVREADEAVALPGSTPAESYLDIGAILAAAKTTGADAIHPGYGFLAENAVFARSVVENGLIWIGPYSRSIEIMGSKIASKQLMEKAGVPVLPTIQIRGLSAVRSAALALGFPVLVKASAGGGGKGMRVVFDPDQLGDAISAAKREAAGAFGDDTVFLEKFLEDARHIEVQVFGDTHGRVVSLFERECSVQRRHQKIIEECPSPAVDADLRRRLSEAAIDAARAVDYVNAGTVEFLVQGDRFYFLEMNTRIQVEHPVTEMVTGLDLVRLQIEIADGGTVGEPPSLSGHAIEARLYAEDPSNEFLPMAGKVHRFELESQPGIRVDSGVETGSEISIHYDPMIAKVIAHASTREAAASMLASSLRQTRIHGPVNNRPLLIRILEHPEFIAGEADIGFLDRHDVSVLSRPLLDSGEEWRAAVAAALADQASAHAASSVMTSLPSGWRNSPSQPQHRSYEGEHGVHEIRYQMTRDGISVEGLSISTLEAITPDLVLISSEGADHRYSIYRYGPVRHVESELGDARLTEVPRFPDTAMEGSAGSLHAPMPGKIIRMAVEVGDRVREGQVLVVLEAMKMEHSLKAPHGGVVTEVRHEADEQVDTGVVLVVVEEG